MEDAASSKQINRAKFKRTQAKKVYHKDQKSSKKYQNPTKIGDGKNKKLSDSHDEFADKLLSQFTGRYADISDEEETETGKAFEELVNAPISTSSFVFKSEKKWTWDSSQFHDYFSVDVDRLARIFNCIPFTEYVGVDEAYLNKDELTSLHSSAEQAKREYFEELKQSLLLEQRSDGQKCEAETAKASQACIDAVDTEDDLDFLLSLKEPVRVLPTNISTSSLRTAEDSKGKIPAKSTKSIDLEKWLDSVLDD